MIDELLQILTPLCKRVFLVAAALLMVYTFVTWRFDSIHDAWQEAGYVDQRPDVLAR